MGARKNMDLCAQWTNLGGSAIVDTLVFVENYAPDLIAQNLFTGLFELALPIGEMRGGEFLDDLILERVNGGIAFFLSADLERLLKFGRKPFMHRGMQT